MGLDGELFTLHLVLHFLLVTIYLWSNPSYLVRCSFYFNIDVLFITLFVFNIYSFSLWAGKSQPRVDVH
ncbi:hypothetical protein F5144DRAFT_136422 [Chaetomium tenue]|uniref:Uncharacterized protein n=1 Tax=Chaetomium tenue TaxID=1854479 RepID=A0ACB7PLD3_9PEZI|nr:hypothetical protein F5144DRAFT_136422 [Chaetomium globosum]